MKNVSAIIILFLSLLSNDLQAADNASCPISDDEKLVCEVVICNPVGLLLTASRNECLKVNRRFAIYLATLGFWSNPPQCKLRDKNCNHVGNANNAVMSPEFCDTLTTETDKSACQAALGISTQSYCDIFEDGQKETCEALIIQ